MGIRSFAAALGFVSAVSGLPESLALPAPARPLAALDPAQKLITLKVDLRNLTGPEDAGKLEERDFLEKFRGVNRIWSQCSIQFNVRSFSNVSAEQLKVPYSPQNQEDLSRIAQALNPKGFPAIPVTVAGRWDFQETGSGLFLTGLGWVFVNNTGVDRIGAMISNTKLSDPSAAAILAHELAHALSLPHIAESANLMGPGGTNELTRDQCAQARRLSENSLRSLVL